MTKLKKEFETLVSTKDEISKGVEVCQVGEGVPAIYLEKNEMRIFEYIPTGYDNKVKLKTLASYTNMDTRTVSFLIHSMRNKGVPIGSDRNTGGYYIWDNELERELTLLQFEADLRTKLQTYSSLLNAPLDNWIIAEAK